MDVMLRPVTDVDVEVFCEYQFDAEARRMAVPWAARSLGTALLRARRET